MDTPSTHVMTIANSIIGVSILAMPYCFKQCGILLSILMLILSSIISRLACHFLLKSAIKARLKTFEFLAYHAFGSLGKFIIEIGMIGFLLGTCIAFFVVMGDLGPQIVSQTVGLKTTSTVRTSVLVILAVFCILPLGLLRNVDSLSGVCTATIGFYICLVLKIMGESAPHILVGDWYDKVEFWRTEGTLQCIPIFSMALFCQTQLFEIYQAIPNASLERMNDLIRIAVNICTSVYIFVGIFGYIALADESFTGNVLMSFKPSFMTEMMKVGFVLSVAFSFPLIIFPCRASLFSLLYKPTYVLHDSGTNYIPEGKFRLLTFMIVSVSLIIGVLIPNIELVLGLVGSTIGVMICVLFPATCFICMSTKNTNERILAQIMLFIGVVVMVLGTYANIYAIEEAHLYSVTERVDVVPLQENENIIKAIEEHKVPVLDQVTSIPGVAEKDSNNGVKIEDLAVLKEVRHEPPQPVEPEEVAPEKSEEIPIEPKKLEEIPDSEIKPQPLESEKSEDSQKEMKQQPLQPIEPKMSEEAIKTNNVEVVSEKNEKIRETAKADGNIIANYESEVKKQPLDNLETVKKSSETPVKKVKENVEINRSEQVDIEAIKKEEKEIIQQEKEKHNEYEKNIDLRDQISELQKQNEVQQQIVQEQKKILEEIKQRQEALLSEQQGQNEIDKVNEEKLKAVKEIETIAKQAIKTLVENDGNIKSAVGKINSNEVKIKKEADVNIEILKLNPNANDVTQNAVNDLIKQSKLPETSPDSSNLQEQNEVIKLKNLVPIPIAKSNNISVFAGMNFSNNQANVSPQNKSEASKENLRNIKNSQTEVDDNKNTDEKLINNQNSTNGNKQTDENSEKKEDIQAIRRDILSRQALEREKRDADEICDKSDEPKSDKTESQTEDSGLDDLAKKEEMCDGGDSKSKIESAIETERKNLFNLNVDLINQFDLSKSVLDSSLNVAKNSKK